MPAPTVFVCGVTGNQGGATARNLLANGAQVHAVVRNPTSQSAVAIQSLGAKLFPGEYDNEDAIKAAMAGCSSAFLNLSPNFAELGGEVRLAKSIIGIAKDAGVKHFIYTSSPAVNTPEKLTHWDPQSALALVLLSKQVIEEETRSAGFEFWTILRPGNFMANFIQPLVRMQAGLVEQSCWTSALEKTTTLPMVDHDTIGKFACAAFLDSAKFNKQEIELADELLMVDQILAKLSYATGRNLTASFLSQEDIDAQKKTNPLIGGQLAMRDMAKFVDMKKVKGWGVPLSSFDSFIERERKGVIDTYKQQ